MGCDVYTHRGEGHLLLQAYERKAHIALGYKSWGEYFEAEFGRSAPHGYRLLDASRVIKAIEGRSPIGESPNLEQTRVVRAIEAQSTNVDRPTEYQARLRVPAAVEGRGQQTCHKPLRRGPLDHTAKRAPAYA